MKYRKIPNTDLEVSAICLGTWVFGGDMWSGADDAQSIAVVERAIEKGVNFIDTAPIYGYGRSEEVIGRALEGKKGVMIATKCGLEGKGTSIKTNLTPRFIREEIENSLRRLKVERVDLYQCHWPDPNTPLEETFGELNKLVDEGKIRYIGVSNFDKGLLEKALKLAPVVSDQVQYSLLDRSIERDLIPFCTETDVSILSYGPLGGGVLTGKYKKLPFFAKDDARNFFYKYYTKTFWDKEVKLISVLESVASKHVVPISQVAINWVLGSKTVASCIVGCRTAEQLEANVRASDWSLTSEELSRIQEEYVRIFD